LARWRSFALIATGSMLDLFDFFIVGYWSHSADPNGI
jgi:hypothetical protein